MQVESIMRFIARYRTSTSVWYHTSTTYHVMSYRAKTEKLKTKAAAAEEEAKAKAEAAANTAMEEEATLA